MKRFIEPSANIMVEFYQASRFETAWVNNRPNRWRLCWPAFPLTTDINVRRLKMRLSITASHRGADLSE